MGQNRDEDGLYWDNGKENGNFCLGFRVQGRGFPKTRGTSFEAPIKRAIVFCCLAWGPPIKKRPFTVEAIQLEHETSTLHPKP